MPINTAQLSLGIAIGSTWPELFKGWTPFLFLLFLISGGEACMERRCVTL
jgi:hypothetical protein